MSALPSPSDEAGRLLALDRSGLLDPGTDPAFRSLMTLVRTIFDVPIAAVSSVGASQQRFKCAIGVSPGAFPRRDSFCNSVIEERDVVAVEDALADPRFAAHPLVTGDMAIRAYLGAPLKTSDGYTIGTICILDREPRSIGAREIALMRQCADLAVDQAELLTIAERDHLTGTWTRRAFLRSAMGEMQRARETGTAASMAVFDLDHFKRVNDGFGHRTGDLVLQTTIAACAPLLREGDTLGRLGGEEFGVLFASRSVSAAAAQAERLRAAIEAARLLGDRRPVFTASFGLAALTPEMQRPEDWLEAADRALYRAKAAGRNRVETT